MLFMLLIIPMIIAIWAQSRVQGAYQQWSRVISRRGMTGAEAATLILKNAGIHNVKIKEVSGFLSDHYNPQEKTLALSANNFRGKSLAALGVAAHEAGHAIQDKEKYGPLQFRASLIPITAIASQALPFIILGGFFFHIFALINIAVIAYLVLTVFQLVTLPVEFDASNRAKKHLIALGILEQDELSGVLKTLNAAGFTYVAAFVASLANLIYFFMLSRRD